MPQRAASAPRPAASPEDCATALLDTLPHAMDALRASMREHVGEELSVPQFRCLAFIARERAPTVGAVAAFIGVTMPTASTMIDRLVRAGAVSTAVDPADRRRSLLQVTETGRARLRRIRQGARQSLAQELARLGADDLLALQRGLDVLRSTFVDAPDT